MGGIQEGLPRGFQRRAGHKDQTAAGPRLCRSDQCLQAGLLLPGKGAADGHRGQPGQGPGQGIPVRYFGVCPQLGRHFLLGRCCHRFLLFPVRTARHRSHSAPRPVKTTATVLNSSLTSPHRDQLSMYFTSSATTSSKFWMLLRPLTCHSPVMPGFIDNRRLWWLSYWLYSSTVGGRVPTRLMLPHSTSKNCGSSSMLVLRMNLPTLVMRGSSCILNIRPFISFLAMSSFLRSSASMYMLRSLWM